MNPHPTDPHPQRADRPSGKSRLSTGIPVAVYEMQSKLPADLKGKLPTAKQLANVVRSVLPEGRGA